MIGRADIEGSKSDVDMNSWSPRISYPCGNFSDTSSWKSQRVRIDRPCVSICSPYWRLQSSESFSCQSTADFWSAWARLRTPALSFNRYAAPAKLPIWICRWKCILMLHEHRGFRNYVSSGISLSNFSHLCYTWQVAKPIQTRVKLNRVFFPRCVYQARSLGCGFAE